MMYSAGLPAYAPTGQHRLPDYPQTALQPGAQTNWIWPSPSPTMTRSPYPWATVDQASSNNNIPTGYCYSPYPACTSGDHTYKTHMITDILKAQTDAVKVPHTYQSKSPTGTGAHMYGADISRATTGDLPLTRQLNVNGYNGHCTQPGPRFTEMTVPTSHSFFPATTGYEGTCSPREGITNGSASHNGIVHSNSASHYIDQISNVTSGTVPMFSPPLGTTIPSLSPSTITNPRSLPQLKDIHQSVEDEKKLKSQKKGRATFSGTQIDELEKAFQVSQYLSTHDRHILAERLGLTENQIKIWFQNRRTKCRRTAWKSRSPSCSKVPTTPTSPSPHTPTTPTTPSTPSSTNSSPTPLTIKLPPIL